MKYINLILLTVISLILLVSITSAQVSHPASEITAGKFDAGDFIFQDNLKVIGNINITTTTSNAILNIDSVGSFSSIDFYDNGVNKWGIGKDSSNKFFIDLFGVGNAFTIDTNRDIRWTGILQSGSVPWGRLTSVPAGLSDGDDTGITSESDPTVTASVKDGVSWSEVTGKPAGFADNVDNVGDTHLSGGFYGYCSSFHWRATVSCRGTLSPAFCSAPDVRGDTVCSCPSGYSVVKTGSTEVPSHDATTNYISCYKN